MAHFAELDENNVVLRIIVVANPVLLDENGEEQEELGKTFCEELFGGKWIQTSYNNNFRKLYAGVGFTYNAETDSFVPPKIYPSWVMGEDGNWKAPVDYPDDGKIYMWSEEGGEWVLHTGPPMPPAET